MLPSNVQAPFERHPLAREATIAVLLFGGFFLWIEALRPLGYLAGTATNTLITVDSDVWALVANRLGHSSVVVVGIVVLTAAYLGVRNLSYGLSVPDRNDWLLCAGAAVSSMVGVGIVSVLARVTGTTLPMLTGTNVASDVPLALPVVITMLGLFVGLPAYVLLAHALIQRTLRTATGPWVAIGLTTGLVGITGPTELANPGLPIRIAVVSLLVAVAIALPTYAADLFDHRWLPWVCAGPLVLFIAGFVGAWLTGFAGAADGAFAFLEVFVVAIGAYTYERTDSLLPPAVAYVSFVGTTEAMIILHETGGLTF